MSARAWDAILAAWSDLNALIAAALPAGAAAGAAGVEGRLGKLREDLSTRLLGQLIPRLRAILSAESRQQLGLPAEPPDPAEASALATRGADDEVQQLIVPLAIHLDERVLGRLPEQIRPSWSRLQEDVIHSDNGGTVFYERLTASLASAQTSPLVLEAYLFCLCEGFSGCFLDAPEQIAAYKDRIARRLPGAVTGTGSGAPGGSRGSASTALSASLAQPKVLPAAVYYAVAAVVAVLSIFVLRALAR